jgi:hypothetical protein
MRFYFNFLSHDNAEILDCEGVELSDWLVPIATPSESSNRLCPSSPKAQTGGDGEYK